MNHYFINNENLPHDYRFVDFEYNSKKFRFLSDAGVFSKEHADPASQILIENVPPLYGSLLDMGCGYGLLGIVLGSVNHVKTTLADINDRAVALAAKNCELNGFDGKVALSDGFSNINENFQTIVTNPPIRAGKQAVFKIYEDAHAHLNEDGQFFAVIRKKHGAESSLHKLTEIFGNCETIYRKKGVFVYRCCK